VKRSTVYPRVINDEQPGMRAHSSAALRWLSAAPWPKGKRRGHPVPVARERSTTHGVHPAVDRAQPAALDAPVDLTIGESEPAELNPRDHRVLASGKRQKACLEVRGGGFPTHVVVKSPRTEIPPRSAAGGGVRAAAHYPRLPQAVAQGKHPARRALEGAAAQPA